MKKVIITSMIFVEMLLGDVTTLLPYIGLINYDKSINKSSKDSAVLSGIYASHGNLEYLLELDYSYTDIAYKDSDLENLKQYDLTLLYSEYYTSYMIKGGVHTISTNDKDLGDGYVFIASIGGYSWDYYDKYSYGLYGYYSYYENPADESSSNANSSRKKRNSNVSIIQFSPYFAYSDLLSISSRNNIALKANYVVGLGVNQNSYLSYEIEDTFYYNSYFITIKAYFGEMKTGVKDGGITVYNTKDVLKRGYGIKVGYYLKSNLIVTAGYALNNYEEYEKNQEGTSSVATATLSYSF